MPRGHARALAFVGLLSFGCSGSSPSSPTSPSDLPGPPSFTVAPIDPSALTHIVPIGNMGPWAHTLPTDHAYLYHHLGSGSFEPIPVLAPAAGTIENTYPGVNGEVKVWVRVNGQFTYYFDHIVLAPGLAPGSRVDAGGVLGTSGGAALDFAVRDMGFTVGFIVPARYGLDTVHARSPLQYFTEPLRSQYYARVQREGAELDGRLSYDLDGTLSGNWFAEDLPVASSSTNDISVGSRQLAFARDVRHPDRQRVSIGGFGFTGVYGVPVDAPDFAAVSPATGVVVYRLLETGEPAGPPGTRQLALLLTQLLDNRRLRVEVVSDQNSPTASFSTSAAIYVR